MSAHKREHSEQDAPRPTRATTGRFRRLLRAVGRALAYAAVGITLLLGLLELDFVLTPVARWAAHRFSPLVNAELKLGHASGGLISGLRLIDVTLSDSTARTLVSVHTASGHISLLPLLGGHVVLSDVVIDRPDVVMTQDPDSTWDLLSVLPDDTSQGTTRLTIRGLNLREGRLTAAFLAPDRDSTLRIHDVTTILALFESPGNAFSLDSLGVRFSPPGSTDTVTISGAARYTDGVLDVGNLDLRSDASSLEAAGRLSFSDRVEDFEDLDFSLAARPLYFGDIHAFVPQLNPAATVSGELRVTGSRDMLDVVADFILGNGGSVSIEGRASPPRATTLSYAATARLSGVDPDYLVRAPGSPATPISGELAVNLSGPSRSELSGDLRLAAEPFSYGDFDVSAVRADVGVTGGLASFEGSTAINGASVRIGGSGRPLDDVPSYRGSISLDHLDIRRFLTDTSIPSDVSVDAWVDLEGDRLETLDGNFDLRLRPSTWAGIDIAAAKTTLRIRDRVVSVDLSAAIGEGTIDGGGNATLESATRYTIERAQLRSIDLAALVGDTTASSVTGRIIGSGIGFDARSARADLDIQLDSTRYGVYRLHSASGRVELDGGRVQASAQARMAGGSLAVRGSGRPFDTRPSFELSSAQFDSLDFAELTQNPSWETRLSGSADGRVRFFDGRFAGNLDAALGPSRINRQDIRSATIRADIDGDDLSADIDASIPGGEIALTVAGRPFDAVPVIDVTDGRIAGIDLSRILANERMRTNLNASFGASLQGLSLESAVGSGRFDIAESTVNSDTLYEGTVIARADSGVVTLETSAHLGGGEIMLVGFARIVGDLDFELAGSATDVSPSRLVGADSLDSRVSIDMALSGSDVGGRRSLRGRLDLNSSAVAGATVNAATSLFSLDDGVLTIDTVTVQSNVGTLAAGGRISISGDSTSLPSDLVVRSEITNLRPLGTLVPSLGPLLALGTVDATVTGNGPDQRIRVDGHLRQIASGDLRVGEARMRALGNVGPGLRLTSGEIRLEAQQPSLPNIAARSVRVDAAYREDRLRFEGQAVVDDQTDARAAGYLDLAVGDPVLTLESLRFGRTSERWELLTTSQVTLGDEYRVSNLLLYSGQQQVALDGFVDFGGEQSLVVSLEGLRIGPVAGFFGYEGVGGLVNGYIDLTGRADDPRILGSLTASITSLGETVGDLQLDLDYSDLEVRISALLRDEAGRTLSGDGRIPVDLRLSVPGEAGTRFGGAAARGATDVTVAADGFAIGWIKPFLDPTVYSDLAGRLTGRVELTGTFDQPSLAGSATIVDGLLGLTEFRVTYSDIRVDARFVEDRILLEHFEASSGRGSVVGHGSVSLAELNLGDFNIDISTDDFLAVDNREYRASVASDLVLTGTTRRPRLDGTVNVVSADIFLAQEIEEFEPVRLSMQDLLTVEQRFGIRLTERDTTTFNFYDAMAMDIRVTLARDTWLRSSKNPTMDIQFTGSLDVSKLPFKDEQVFGSIQVLPERSRIVQFGKSFAIKKGDLTYNGPIDDPALDLQAEYAIRAWRNPDSEVTITLSATGRLDELDVELTSDPTMELTDIVSYIAFGRPASESLHLGGGGEGGSLATGLALGQVANLIEGVAGSGLGLDVVEIEQQGLDTRLTAGKYVHTKLYLSISQPLSLSGSTSGSTFGNKREITAEFEVIESLLLRLLSRKGSISVNLLWQYAY